MLAEYFAPLPTSMTFTIAVCTGSGNLSAAFCCLHAVAPASRAVAAAAIQILTDAGFVGFILPPGLFQMPPLHSKRKAGSVRNHGRRWQRRLAVAARHASTPLTS